MVLAAAVAVAVVVVAAAAVVVDDVEPRYSGGWLFHASSDNIFLAFS